MADLKFPNVRLQLHDLIAKDKHSPPYAMATVAIVFGLIPEHALKVIVAVEPLNMCLCMASAEQIIEEYIRNLQETKDFPPVKASHIGLSLARAAETHIKGNTADSLLSAGMNLSNHDCYRFAPILFDLMLQQLMRYPGLE